MAENAGNQDKRAATDRAPRPFLVGGLGLSGLLAVWASFDAGFGGVAETGDGFGALGLAAIGAGAWLWRRRRPVAPLVETEELHDDRAGAVGAIERLGVAIERLGSELELSKDILQSEAVAADLIKLRADRDALRANLDRETLDVAVVGAPLVGKSAIAKRLAAALSTRASTEPATPTLAWKEIDLRALRTTDSENPDADLPPMLLADCVVYAIGGDLTASERRDIERLVRANQTVFVAWNKSDTVSRTDRDRVLGSIRHQLADLVPTERVGAIAAAPQNGATIDIAPLLTALETSAIEAYRSLVWQQTQRAVRLAIADVRMALNALRRDRAEPIVRRYQWLAAAATIANPVPSLDLLASGSIDTQMLIDLSQIYHRELSLDRARAAFDAIAEMLLKLGLVELSTQAIAGLLKHNPVTFVAGSTVQGISAAYLTHAIGQSAIRYFETEDLESFEPDSLEGASRPWDWARFQGILAQTVAQTRRAAFVRAWFERALSERPQSAPALVPDTETVR